MKWKLVAVFFFVFSGLIPTSLLWGVLSSLGADCGHESLMIMFSR